MDINNLEEGEILNAILNRKFFSENKNFLGVTVGSTGSGKSYFNLRLCELWYKKKFNMEYPIENIGWSPSDIMERVVNGNLKPGEILILEEGGTSMSSLDWQNKIAKLFNYILQSFRSKRIGLLVNLPHYSMLNKQTRMLMHMMFQTVTIDKANQKVIITPYHLQYNQQTGKLYRHKPKILVEGVMEKVHFLKYSKPSQRLVDDYEYHKEKFVSGLSKDVLKGMQKYLQERKPLTAKQMRILEFWKRGVFSNLKIARELKDYPQNISQNKKWMRNKGYIQEDFMDKGSKEAKKT